MSADDATVTARLQRITESMRDIRLRGRDGTRIASVTTDPDRDDYFYLHLDTGQVFRVEVTEVYDRKGA